MQKALFCDAFFGIVCIAIVINLALTPLTLTVGSVIKLAATIIVGIVIQALVGKILTESINEGSDWVLDQIRSLAIMLGAGPQNSAQENSEEGQCWEQVWAAISVPFSCFSTIFGAASYENYMTQIDHEITGDMANTVKIAKIGFALSAISILLGVVALVSNPAELSFFIGAIGLILGVVGLGMGAYAAYKMHFSSWDVVSLALGGAGLACSVQSLTLTCNRM